MRISTKPNNRFPKSSALALKATDVAEQIMAGDELFRAVSNHSSFDLSTVSPNEIAALLRGSNSVAHVRLKKLGFRALASTTGNTVTLNVRKLYSWRGRQRRGVASVVGTLIHEYVHVVDNDSEEDFGHADNHPAGKSNTAPYWIGAQAVGIASSMLGLDVSDARISISAYALEAADSERAPLVPLDDPAGGQSG